MKNFVRIIPRLDIKGPNLVKGIHLEGLRVLGKPEEFAQYYYETGADELLYVDVVASLYGRNSLDQIITKTAQNIFIPLTVAGGIRTIADIKRILKAGADKVSINTAAIHHPQFISEAANIFGASTIAVTIEAIKQSDGSYLAFTDNGREQTDKEVVSWAQEATSLGAGEIIITAVDREGTAEGFDLQLLKKIRQKISVPLVASGGAGSKKDVLEVIKSCGVDGVNIASIFHYQSVKNDHKKKKTQVFEEGNTNFLKNNSGHLAMETTAIPELKKFLDQNKIFCRYTTD